MGIEAEAHRMGVAAHRDHLFDQYIAAAIAAASGDTYATAWLKGWNATA